LAWCFDTWHCKFCIRISNFICPSYTSITCGLLNFFILYLSFQITIMKACVFKASKTSLVQSLY
jgi:hypothetical protein